MFIENKYSKYYYNIVNNAKSRELGSNTYTEKHHIIPKSCGGPNSKDNLVRLTAREHFVCHLLLPKMLVGSNHHKMVHALWRMCNSLKSDYKINSKVYTRTREQHAHILSTVGTSGQFKVGRSTWNKGIPRTPAEKKRMSESRKGIKTGRTADMFTTEWKTNISNSKKGKATWNKGIEHSDDTKKLMSLKAQARTKKTCPHCNTQTSPGNYTRWHGDNCRQV